MKEARRDKTERVLEFLEGTISLTGEIMDAFFSSYPSRRFRSSQVKRSRRGVVPSPEEHQRFYSLLSRLRRQGLIASGGGMGRRESRWRITKRGLEKLFFIRDRKQFSLRDVAYSAEKDSAVRVVTFDIPELERHKRVWLRVALLALGFSMCQRSVWVGKQKIPRGFLEDLRDREMLSYVQIFEVSKEGSLDRVV